MGLSSVIQGRGRRPAALSVAWVAGWVVMLFIHGTEEEDLPWRQCWDQIWTWGVCGARETSREREAQEDGSHLGKDLRTINMVIIIIMLYHNYIVVIANSGVLLCAWLCSKIFLMHINSFNLHNNSMMLLLLLSSSYTWGNRCSAQSDTAE